MMRLTQGDFFRSKHPPKGSVDLIIADPNFGMTSCEFDRYTFDELYFFLFAYDLLRPGGIVLVHAAMPFTVSLFNSDRATSWWKYEWVWEKSNATGHLQAKKRPLKAHETIQVFVKPGGTPTYNPQMTEGKPYKWASRRTESEHFENRKNTRIDNKGTRYPRSVLQFQQERGLHPTQKPVPLVEYLIRTYTNDGDTVLDPFMGSGTSKVACRNIGKRHYYGYEINGNYFKIASKR